MVRIPINSQPIPAYSRVARSHLLHPEDGRLMHQRVPPQATVGMSIVGVDQSGFHVESRVESVKNVDDRVVFVVTGGAEVQQANTFTLGGAIMNINAIIGRVVKADKRAGMGFQEKTFFPQGTPEGLAGATPAGKPFFREGARPGALFRGTRHILTISTFCTGSFSNETKRHFCAISEKAKATIAQVKLLKVRICRLSHHC